MLYATDPISEDPLLGVGDLDSHDLTLRKTLSALNSWTSWHSLSMCTNIKYWTLVLSCFLQCYTDPRSMHRKEIEKIDI